MKQEQTKQFIFAKIKSEFTLSYLKLIL